MIRCRIKRIRRGGAGRSVQSPVDYAEQMLTTWITIPDLVRLTELEDAVDSINRRRIIHPSKNDYYVVETEFIQATNLDELTDLLNDIDKGSRQHEHVFGPEPKEKPQSPAYDVKRYREWRR